MRTAVITNAQSAGFWFPVWHHYYSKQFGANNLFVFAQRRDATQFSAFELGGLLLTENKFDDLERAQIIADHIERLLEAYDCVISIDTDEFLFPDPRRYSSLKDYIDLTDAPYITAYGYDVIQGRDEPRLDLTKPLLVEQRKFAYPITSMNKTCVTKIPMRWGRGFHFATKPPLFESLFLFHMKRADIDLQLEWFAHMSQQVLSSESQAEYYRPDRDKIIAYHDGVLKRPLMRGIDNLIRNEFNAKYLAEVEQHPQNKIYYGKHFHEHILFEIPDEFRGML